MKKFFVILFFAIICGAVFRSCGSETVVTVKSSECDILELVDEINSVNWEINGTNISAVYSAYTDLSTIAPVIVVSEKASVSPQSGEKVDFSNEKEITYTVTAEDGTEKAYKARASYPEIEYPFEVPITEYLIEYPLCQWLYTFILKDNVLIINNKEDMENQISCRDGSYAAINFSEHSLLLALVTSSGNVRLLDSNLIKENANEYTLKLTISPEGIGITLTWIFAFLVPKIADENIVELSYQPKYFK